MSLRLWAANTAWLASRLPAYRAFRDALERPGDVQAARLKALLRRNAGSAYGRARRFDAIGSVREYQTRVPVVTYEELAPWIEAILNGRANVLTTEPVLMVEQTGGSTGGAKLIPYTASVLREFRGAVAAWMVDLALHAPGLRGGGAYWSISPATRQREMTTGGLPVGFDDDTEYFAPPERWLLRQSLVTPRELSGVACVPAHRYVTLRFLLDAPHLTFISVWNPSVLGLLMAALTEWAPRLIADIERGTLTPPAALPAALGRALERRLRPRRHRARHLRARLAERGHLTARDCWPGLRLISCWTSAAAARGVPGLTALFPGVVIQGKGLLATEGVVSIPLLGHPGAAIAVTGHFYEFLPLGDTAAPRPRLAHELLAGETYEVLLTTGGGLYRYALGDAVRVVGHVGRTPLIEFVGKRAHVSDLCGEKLAESHVAAVLEAATARFGLAGAFLMLAPEWGAAPYYTLFLEIDDDQRDRIAPLLEFVEAELQRSPTYVDCRALGQLGPVRGFRVARHATASYLTRCARLGQRVGAIKPTALHTAPDWQAHMDGALV